MMTEFVIAFVFVSLALFVVVKFVSFAVVRETNYYSQYVKTRSVKIYKGFEEYPTRECEDNPLWFVKGGEKCR